MKKLILIFATAILGLASCQQKTDDKAAIELAKQAAIDSMKMVAQAQEVKQMVIDSMQKVTPTTQVTQSTGESAQSTSVPFLVLIIVVLPKLKRLLAQVARRQIRLVRQQ
jgi:hypothetical protein